MTAVSDSTPRPSSRSSSRSNSPHSLLRLHAPPPPSFAEFSHFYRNLLDFLIRVGSLSLRQSFRSNTETAANLTILQGGGLWSFGYGMVSCSLRFSSSVRKWPNHFSPVGDITVPTDLPVVRQAVPRADLPVGHREDPREVRPADRADITFAIAPAGPRVPGDPQAVLAVATVPRADRGVRAADPLVVAPAVLRVVAREDLRAVRPAASFTYPLPAFPPPAPPSLLPNLLFSSLRPS